MKLFFRYAFVLLSLFAAVGCSSDLPSGASPLVGATIQGTVNGGAAANGGELRSLSGAGAGLRVTVIGTSLQTTTDSAGRFTIRGTPTGTIVLRFQGGGADATVQIEGLTEGQVVTISVRINGARATLEGAPQRQQVELEGRIESINAPRLVVAGRAVVTDANTKFGGRGRVKSLADLRVGDRVEVEGNELSDASVLARKIDREDDD